jgi:hypothetical protein
MGLDHIDIQDGDFVDVRSGRVVVRWYSAEKGRVATVLVASPEQVIYVAGDVRLSATTAVFLRTWSPLEAGQ